MAKGMIEGRNRSVQSPWQAQMKGAYECLGRPVDAEERLTLRTFDGLFVGGLGGPTLLLARVLRSVQSEGRGDREGSDGAGEKTTGRKCRDDGS